MGFSIHRCCLLLPLIVSAALAQEDRIDVDQSLKLLGDPDMNVRIAALRKLEYSLDPRIPEACLPLLRDEGNSTRRIAARAIGSRWHQIPKDRVQTFVTALEGNLFEEGRDRESWMALRGIGLLKRDYGEKTFSSSANGRWVIYGRYSLPCLIDTENETEELLGWHLREKGAQWPWFLGDGEIRDRARWHPEKEIVALELSLNRYDSIIWVWRHREGLKPIPVEGIVGALGLRKNADRIGYQNCFIRRWDGDELMIGLRCVVFSKTSGSEAEAEVGWNCETKELRKISLNITPSE